MSDPAPKPRRSPWLRALVIVLAVLIVLPATMLGALYIAAYDRVVGLPKPLQTRIVAQIDDAMRANEVRIGGIGVAMRGGVAPQIVLSDIEMLAEGGLRAAFPEVSFRIGGLSLLRGQVRPERVEVSGAGLRIIRRPGGQLDLALAASPDSDGVGLGETLARLDTMFMQPAFDDLEAVIGTDLELALLDLASGRTMRIYDATAVLERVDQRLSLGIGGRLEGQADASLRLDIERDGVSGATLMALAFANIPARDIANTSPALNFLDLLSAPISGDILAHLRADGTLGDVEGELDAGPGEITLGDGVAPRPFSLVGMAFDYHAEAQRLTFSDLRLSAPALSFEARGHANVIEDGNSFVGQFQISDIAADPGDVFEAALEIDGAAADFRLSLEPLVRLDIGQAVIFDGAASVHADGHLLATPRGIEARINARLDEIDAGDLMDYWPPAAIPNTRRWMRENLLQGVFRDLNAAIRVDPGEATRHAVQFDFDDTVLRPVRLMPPVEDAAGYLSLTDGRLVVRLGAGQMPAPTGGAVSVAGTSMLVADTSIPGPPAEVDLVVAGAVPDLLSLLAGPPVNLLRGDARLDPATLAQGQVRARGHLSLPLVQNLQPEQVETQVRATITGVRSDTLVPGRVLSAESLAVDLGGGQVEISGQAALDGLPLSGVWRRALGPDAPPGSRAEGRAELSPETLDQVGVRFPGGLISGSAEADFILDLSPEEPARLRLNSDLAGLGMRLPALAWSKPAAADGVLDLDMVLGPTPAITALSLQASGLQLDGSASLRPGGGGLDVLAADRFRLGGWIDVTGSLTGRGAGRAPAIAVTGGQIDLRNAPVGARGGATGGGQGGPITLALDRLRVTDTIALTSLRADLTSTGGLSGQFRGEVNGAVPVTGTLLSTETGPAIRLNSEDGGAFMRAAGLLNNAYGGEMQLVLAATGETGTYRGQLNMTNPRLRDAPAMAELLNIMSVVGLLEQLGGEGINLGAVEAEFRLTPRAVYLERGAALGPSMGLSMDGIYDVVERRLDMQGVVSPFYLLNGVIGALFAPRQEGLFGFSYRLTGPPEDSDVTVNPLSILTPGVFRDIFRAPPPQVSQ